MAEDAPRRRRSSLVKPKDAKAKGKSEAKAKAKEKPKDQRKHGTKARSSGTVWYCEL